MEPTFFNLCLVFGGVLIFAAFMAWYMPPIYGGKPDASGGYQPTYGGKPKNPPKGDSENRPKSKPDTGHEPTTIRAGEEFKTYIDRKIEIIEASNDLPPGSILNLDSAKDNEAYFFGKPATLILTEK